MHYGEREPPELVELERLASAFGDLIELRVMCEVTSGTRSFPVYAISLGNSAPTVPAVGYFGGVHGVERIGSAVVLAFLRSVIMRLRWDATLHHQLEHLRMVFMPVVNPAGLARGTRANPAGVDLMRNAPLDARDPVPFLLGGQRFSPWLPWYRGRHGDPMQPESQALCRVVEGELLSHDFSIAVDCHSGFGTTDRIWFPYASTRLPIAHLPEMHALAEILDQTQLHHPYLFEPQSNQYLTHGDLWDYLYQQACLAPGCIHLPLTLEMGSWLWVKKNPRQMLSLLGFFNPLIAHRHARVLRRHIHWLDFIGRAACGHRGWVPTGHERARHRELALRRWYDMGGLP